MKWTKLFLLICGFMFAYQTHAQDDINIKIMNATHLAHHQVIVAIKSAGDPAPTIVEIVELGNYRDYTNLSLPDSKEFYLFITPNSVPFEKLSAVPADYIQKVQTLGMDGVKGCNIVVSGSSADNIHFNMTNIQW